MESDVPTGDSDARREILRLELEVEQLAKAMENCRRIIFISRAGFVIGVSWLFALLIGALTFAPLSLVFAISVVIFSVVSFGSNVSTLRQFAEAMEKAEARRAELIGTIDLRVVRDS